MATITYQFKIGKDEIPYSASTIIKIQDVEYKLSLLSLRYHKKMFQPGKIEAKLLLTQNVSSATKAPELKDLVDYFKTKNNNVSLSKTVDGVKKDIATNYYVYKVLPEYKRKDSGQYVHLKLEIYSPDHKLTLDKYCRSYTNQKLVEDILKGELDGGILAKAGFTKDTIDGSLTHYLNYIHSIANNTVTKREFIQPYLVQFNESFYDFIARTANRCGEFFYYEEGKLYLGLHEIETKDESTYKSHVDIDKDKVLSINYAEADDTLVGYTNLKGCRIDSMNKDAAGQYATGDYNYTEHVSYDDFLNDFFTEDQFTTFWEELIPQQYKSITELVGALLTGGIAGAVSYAAGLAIPQIFFANSYADTKNAYGNEKWVLSADKGTGKQRHASEQYDETNKKAVLYGSLLVDDVKKNNYEYQQNLNQTFYNFIRQGCDEVSRHQIQVSLGTQQGAFLLGQKVTFESQSEVKEKEEKKKTGDVAFNFPRYLITEVNDVLKVEVKEGEAIPEDWMPGQKVVLTPLYTVNTKKFSEGTDKSVTLACPPVSVPFVRTSGPQRAYIAESKDPSSFARVCIRYPWQKKDDESSPWIRVAVPYAPCKGENGGGFYFQHEIGDEVLIDYEEGNIEHPFVVGSLYTARAAAPRKGSLFHTWNPSNTPTEPNDVLSIVSRKGHRLVFNDNGNAEDFMRSALPGLDLIKPLTNKFNGWRFDQGGNSPLSGGLTLCDKWGMYKIDCSSTDRAINIEAPFGSIGLNAFTGITISAECGNVSIKGKNVTIEAGNELKLLSGTNIAPEGQSIGRDLVLKGIATAAIDKTAAKLVDLTLVRCVIEVFLKPVAGTMTLKSKRYMLLMAGQGAAEIPAKAYTFKGIHNKEKDAASGLAPTTNDSKKPWKWEMLNERIKMARSLRVINQSVILWYEQLAVLYANVQKTAKTFAYDSRQTNHLPDQIIEKAFLKDKSSDLFTENDIDFVQPEVQVIKAEDVFQVIENANAVHDAVLELYAFCEQIRKSTFLAETSEHVYVKEIKKAIKDQLKDEVINDVFLKKHTEIFNQNIGTFSAHATIQKRMLAYHVINDTCAVEPANDDAFLKFDDPNDFADDNKWGQFIQNLSNFSGKRITGKTGALARFGLEIYDYFRQKMSENFAVGKWWHEKDIWSSAQNGEILFSDKDGKETLNFENGGLNHKVNEDGFLEQVKGELWSL